MKTCTICDLPSKPWRSELQEDGVDYCVCSDNYTEGTEIDVDSFEDWRGNTIRPGDVIVYPVMSGRSALLAIGLVERIYAKRDYSRWAERLRVKRLERGSTYGDRGTGGKEYAVLMYWDRCMKFQVESPLGLGE